MQLHPRRERGRCDRKAAAYASEIARLRDDGFTFEAIREALLDIGIELSEATLRREVRRWWRQPGARSGSTLPPVPSTDAPAPAPVASIAMPPTPTGASGREIAEAFFNTHPANPLLKAKDSQ